MTIALILVLFSLLALLFLIRLARGRVLAAADNRAGQIRPVDIEAFRNLIDPAEAEFLRARLSRADFRVTQRERLRAAVEYISQAARNAAILVRLGEAARLSPEPSVAEAGERLVDSAIRLRLYAFQAITKLYLGTLMPGAQLAPLGLAESYERMTGLVLSLRRVQQSAGQFSAAL
jgi:hypothetical protein